MKRRNNEDSDDDLTCNEETAKPIISHAANMLVGKYLMINFFEETDSKKPKNKDMEIKAFFFEKCQNPAMAEAGEYLVKRNYITQDKWNAFIKEAKEKKVIEEEFEKVSKKFRKFAANNSHMRSFIMERVHRKNNDYQSKLKLGKELIDNIQKSPEEFVIITSAANFEMEEGFIRRLNREQQLPINYFVINHYGTSWDIKKNRGFTEKKIMSSAQDSAGGYYTILQILANSSSYSVRGKVNEILSSFEESEQQEIKAAFDKVKTKNILGEKSSNDLELNSNLIRKFVRQIILNSAHPNKAEIFAKVTDHEYKLSTDDIEVALDGLGIKHITRKSLSRVEDEFHAKNNQYFIDWVFKIFEERGEEDAEKNESNYKIAIKTLERFLEKEKVNKNDRAEIFAQIKELKKSVIFKKQQEGNKEKYIKLKKLAKQEYAHYYSDGEASDGEKVKQRKSVPSVNNSAQKNMDKDKENKQPEVVINEVEKPQTQLTRPSKSPSKSANSLSFAKTLASIANADYQVSR